MSKKITIFNIEGDLSRQDSLHNRYPDMNEQDLNALSEFQAMILSSAVNLIRQIDMYADLKRRLTGKADNCILEFRQDAVEVAIAAAHEMSNADDATFSENDSVIAAKLLDLLGIEGVKKEA